MNGEFFYNKKRPEIAHYFPKETLTAYRRLSTLATAEGALPAKVKELIAVACVHMTQCSYCINGHAKRALKLGTTKEELAEAILIAAALSAGACMAHAHFTLDVNPE
jgi:AhpD family alkylhydroperoxidase